MPVIISPSRARCGLARTASSGSSRSSVELGAPGSAPATPAQKLCRPMFQPSSPPASAATHGPLSALAVAYESDGDDGFVSAEEASDIGGTPCSAAKYALAQTSSSTPAAATPSQERPPPSFLAHCCRCKPAPPVPSLLQRFDEATLQQFNEAREPVPHLSSVLRAFVGETNPEINPGVPSPERLALQGPAAEATSVLPYNAEPLTAAPGTGAAEPAAHVMELPTDGAPGEVTPDGTSTLCDAKPLTAAPCTIAAEPPPEAMEPPSSVQAQPPASVQAEQGAIAVATPPEGARRELTPDGPNAFSDSEQLATPPAAGVDEPPQPEPMEPPTSVQAEQGTAAVASPPDCAPREPSLIPSPACTKSVGVTNRAALLPLSNSRIPVRRNSSLASPQVDVQPARTSVITSTPYGTARLQESRTLAFAATPGFPSLVSPPVDTQPLRIAVAASTPHRTARLTPPSRQGAHHGSAQPTPLGPERLAVARNSPARRTALPGSVLASPRAGKPVLQVVDAEDTPGGHTGGPVIESPCSRKPVLQVVCAWDALAAKIALPTKAEASPRVRKPVQQLPSPADAPAEQTAPLSVAEASPRARKPVLQLPSTENISAGRGPLPGAVVASPRARKAVLQPPGSADAPAEQTAPLSGAKASPRARKPVLQPSQLQNQSSSSASALPEKQARKSRGVAGENESIWGELVAQGDLPTPASPARGEAAGVSCDGAVGTFSPTPARPAVCGMDHMPTRPVWVDNADGAGVTADGAGVSSPRPTQPAFEEESVLQGEMPSPARPACIEAISFKHSAGAFTPMADTPAGSSKSWLANVVAPLPPVQTRPLANSSQASSSVPALPSSHLLPATTGRPSGGDASEGAADDIIAAASATIASAWLLSASEVPFLNPAAGGGAWALRAEADVAAWLEGEPHAPRVDAISGRPSNVSSHSESEVRASCIQLHRQAGVWGW
jgi:hypothetical protein